jgi:hypothetical protein
MGIPQSSPGPRGHDGKGYEGPTYGDIRALCAEFEQTFGRKVDFLLGPEDVPLRWRRSRMWVRCRAYTGENPFVGAWWGGAPLGGNGGARTLPGAMLAALEGVWRIAEREGMFPSEPSP